MRLGARGEDDEAPLHYESCAVRGRLLAAAWVLGGACVGGGIATIVGGRSTLLEPLGMLVAMAGGLVLAAAVRCRRFELVVTRRWLRSGAGPLTNKVPVGLVGAAVARPASSWRRLYAEREVAIEVGEGRRPLVVPSADPSETVAELGTKDAAGAAVEGG